MGSQMGDAVKFCRPQHRLEKFLGRRERYVGFLAGPTPSGRKAGAPCPGGARSLFMVPKYSAPSQKRLGLTLAGSVKRFNVQFMATARDLDHGDIPPYLLGTLE